MASGRKTRNNIQQKGIDDATASFASVVKDGDSSQGDTLIQIHTRQYHVPKVWYLGTAKQRNRSVVMGVACD